MFFFFFYCVHIGVCGYCWCPLDGILSIHETPEGLHGLENYVIWASNDKVVSSKWVKLQFWENYPFKKSPPLYSELAVSYQSFVDTMLIIYIPIEQNLQKVLYFWL